MCGISGIINKTNTPVPQSEIEEMNRLIIHRGPDSGSCFYGKNFAFGNRRLKIIDLSDSANQPMTYLNKYTITYNGEIYNYIELKEELRKIGYSFSTASDTEVILAAYDHYGIDCVTKFNGMWAFALYDKDRNIILCSRDRFGIKPFYYSELPDKFVFGSEIKQLLKYQHSKKANMPVLIDYLVVGNEDHTNDTFFLNINKLEQAHYMIYDLYTHSYIINRYYNINIDPAIANLNERDSVNLYRTILLDSIKLRLRSDVKVGTCLSGGLDSSSVASLASRIINENYQTNFVAITAISAEKKTDESDYAKKVVQHSGLEWHTILPQKNDFADNIDRIIALQEEPFVSPAVFMQYKVFEKAKNTKCVVMLDGQGGDETLLGYERYYVSYLLSHGLGYKIRNFFLSVKNSRLLYKELFSYYFYFVYPSIRLRYLKQKYSFITKDYFNLVNKTVLNEISESFHDLKALQQLEISRLQLPHLLKYEDKNSMYHSIESRLPFIDYRLVETALSINNDFKIKDGWTKYLLRKSTEEFLPPEITWRKNKLGFNAPEKTWITSISPMIKESLNKSEILNKITGKKDMLRTIDPSDLRMIWRLFNIAKWEETFNVRIY